MTEAEKINYFRLEDAEWEVYRGEEVGAEHPNPMQGNVRWVVKQHDESGKAEGDQPGISAGFFDGGASDDFWYTCRHDEVIFMKEGAQTAIFEDGSQIEFKGGELVFLPRGTKARWILPGPVKEVFAYFGD